MRLGTPDTDPVEPRALVQRRASVSDLVPLASIDWDLEERLSREDVHRAAWWGPSRPGSSSTKEPERVNARALSPLR